MKEVLRLCVATREMLPKEKLIRIVSSNGLVMIDRTGRANGRGAYLSKTQEALDLAKKKNLISRALKVNVPETIYEELRKIING